MIRRSGCGCVLIFVLQAAAYSPALLRLVKPSHSYLAARAPAVAMHDSADLPAKGRRKRAKATDADAKDAGRNEGEAPIAWYLRNIGNHELLTSEEELELSTLVQRMLAVRAKGTQMEEDLGRPPTQSELAAALSLGTPPPPLPQPPPPPPSLSFRIQPHTPKAPTETRGPACKHVARRTPSPVLDLRPPPAQALTPPLTLMTPAEQCRVGFEGWGLWGRQAPCLGEEQPNPNPNPNQPTLTSSP